MRVRRLTLGLVSSLCVMVGVLVLGSVPALAYDVHDYLSQITEVPAKGPSGETVSLPGVIEYPSAMTVDKGDLWATRRFSGPGGGYRVDEFDDATGAFLRQLPDLAEFEYSENGLAVGHSTGESVVYVSMAETAGSRHGVVNLFNASGALEATWTGADTPQTNFGFGYSLAGIGVDNSTSLTDWAAGDVYVADSEQNLVDVFKPEAGGKEKYVTQITGTAPGAPFVRLDSIAVSSANGDVLVDEEENGESVIDVFKPGSLAGEYEFVRQITGPPPNGRFPGRVQHIAVDGGDGDIYVQLYAFGSEETSVEEFSETGAFIGEVTGAAVPGGKFGVPGPYDVAVDSESHRVFVGVHHANEVEGPDFIATFGANVVLPDVTTTAVSEVAPTGAGSFDVTLNGTVNPDEAGNATCAFAWGETAELGRGAPCAAPVTNGKSPQAVRASIVNLQPDVTYSYRLQASNGNGANPGEPWQDVTFTTPGPGLQGSFATDVSAEAATLGATIDPHGVPTSLYFEYVDQAGYDPSAADPYAAGADSPGPVSIGSGEAGVSVASHVTELARATIYHYRVVVLSELEPGKIETFYGPDETIATQPSGASFQLPDDRQWELVSPANMHGAAMGQIGEGIIQASADGDAFAGWASLPTEAGAAGNANGVYMLSGRGSDGWVGRDIVAPNTYTVAASVGNGKEYRFFSEDLSRAVVQPFGSFTPLSPQATEPTAYLRSDFPAGDPSSLCAESCYTPLVTASQVPVGTHFGEYEGGECRQFRCGPSFLGASPDGKHIVLESPARLTETPNEGQGALYEWSEGALQMVSLLPEGETNEHGGAVALGATLVGEHNKDARHAVSDDGSRIVFETASGGKEHLYLRDTTTGTTVRLDLPEGGAATGSQAPRYMTASADGSRIFFLDEAGLTRASSPGGEDLYEYDVEAPAGSRLKDLSVDQTEAANVANVIGASEDGSYVYFTAAGALAAGASPAGECPQNSSPSDTLSCNLYVSHEGAIALVAVLSPQDSPDWAAGDLSHLTGRVSPNGRYLAFMSQRSLTGYDNRDAVSGRPDEEVYLYDSGSSSHPPTLVCASCNPTGARPVGQEYHPQGSEQIDLVGADRVWEDDTWLAALVPPWTRFAGGEARYQSRYLSNDGRLFFDSHDPLAPQDVGGSWGVYEYEPPGVGNCTTAASSYSERAAGCQSLISSGTSGSESAFLDASETGGDVFFLTYQDLVPGDYNDTPHVYDAHECTTASPCVPASPVAPPPCESGDACKAAPNVQPAVFGAPPSATFSGRGNLVPAAPVVTKKVVTEKTKVKCKRGKARNKHGVCVAKSKRRKAKRSAQRSARGGK